MAIKYTGPTQGTGPPQQKKMTKYTGPTQDTEDDRVFNKQFLLINIARGTTDPWVDTITGGTL